MSDAPHEGLPHCPKCGLSTGVRPKTLLVNQLWDDDPEPDGRVKFFAGPRVDDIAPDFRREQPLRQFVEAYFCEDCSKGFVPDSMLAPNPRRLP